MTTTAPAKKTLPVALVALAALVTGGCTAGTPQRCSRVELGSTGPESGFRLTVPTDDALRIDSTEDRFVVAFSMVGASDRPVTLVHREDGRETGRWVLTPGKPSGIASRCAMGLPGAVSTCTASFSAGPVPLGGEWTIEAGASTILEAGLSARLCR